MILGWLLLQGHLWDIGEIWMKLSETYSGDLIVVRHHCQRPGSDGRVIRMYEDAIGCREYTQ